MKVGDLVRMKRGYSAPGLVTRIDSDHYGSRQAFKRYDWERGKCINTLQADGIGPTKDGIRDRVLVFWNDEGFSYEESIALEVISESR